MERSAESIVTAEALSALLRELTSAIKKLGIYPPGHPASVKAAEKPFSMLRDLLSGGKGIVFAVVDGKLIGNGFTVDDRLLGEGLGRALHESGLASIAFDSNLPFEEFEKFLSYLNVKREQRNLEAFLKNENMHSISVGKFQYQLVGDDERVVSADMADSIGSGSGGGGGIQQTLVEALRSHPSLLLQLLVKPTEGGAVPGPTDGSEHGTGDRGGWGGVGSGEGNGSGFTGAVGGVRLDLSDHIAVARELAEVNDDELLALLTASLRERMSNVENINRLDVGNALFAFKELLSNRDTPHLMPQLKQAVQNLGIIDGGYLEMILAADSSPRKVAHSEIENFRTDLLIGSTSPERSREVTGWLETIDDKQYTEDFVRKLYADLEARSYELSQAQTEALLGLASVGAEHPDSNLAQTQLAELKDRVGDPAIALSEFRVLVDQLAAYYLKFIELGRYEEARAILHLINEKFNAEIIYAEGVADYAANAAQRFTSAHVAEGLMSRLIRNFEVVSKPMTPLLESFIGLEPILVFTSYLAHDNRGVRVLLIRILSGFGERILNAFKLVLTDRSLTARGTGQSELPPEQWFKVRNMLLILGNVPHPDSVAMVRPFADDADERVVKEALIALERLRGEEAAMVIARLLSHRSEEVQLKALHALMQIGSEAEYPYVEDYFLRNALGRNNSLPALIKLDRQRALSFLASVLLGESEACRKFLAKADEELNETIVRTFIQLRSVIFDDVLRKYVKNSTRSLFGQLRKPNSVKIAEKYLRTVANGL
jgi:hypothetical protein